jgi:predicted signal transduction protein with EAL and GGDEF domain
MYRAKDLGKNRFVIYQQELSPDNSDLLQMETALRKGLDSNEFALYYQPVVSLETGWSSASRHWSAGSGPGTDW